MSIPDPANTGDNPKKFKPYVPENMEMREFTLRAVLLGLLMTVVLGAANAYLGLRAGITIAATYPAAVIAMAAMRAWKGSLLEENIARTAGSIGEGIAAGAIFTIPAFLIAKAWPSFRPGEAYWKSTALIMVGSVLGVLFISLVRRVMVEDPELPFPESVAASEIHKAGQRGAEAAKYLFWNIGVGGVVYMLGRFGLFAADKDFHFAIGTSGTQPGPTWRGWKHQTYWPRAEPAHSPRPASVRLIWAWATSSDCAWHRFSLPAACWPGDCWSHCSFISWARSSDSIFQRTLPTTGQLCRSRCGGSSCVPSPSAECWWERRTRYSECGRA